MLARENSSPIPLAASIDGTVSTCSLGRFNFETLPMSVCQDRHMTAKAAASSLLHWRNAARVKQLFLENWPLYCFNERFYGIRTFSVSSLGGASLRLVVYLVLIWKLLPSGRLLKDAPLPPSFAFRSPSSPTLSTFFLPVSFFSTRIQPPTQRFTMKRTQEDMVGDDPPDGHDTNLSDDEDVGKVAPYDAKKEPRPQCKLYDPEYQKIRDNLQTCIDLFASPFYETSFNSGPTQGLLEDLKRRLQDKSAEKVRVGVVGDMKAGMIIPMFTAYMQATFG